jgi:hypothetical protein
LRFRFAGGLGLGQELTQRRLEAGEVLRPVRTLEREAGSRLRALRERESRVGAADVGGENPAQRCA